MTVAIYIRVSTEEQAQQGYSVDFQRERLIAYCKSQGWDDFKLYIDDGYTGTNMNRPALKRMIRHVEDKTITTVLVYKLDRLGRKQKDVLFLLEDVFEDNEVGFKSATEPFDTTTPFGKATIGILAVFAQLERDMIIDRTTSGRRQRVSNGKWYGGQVPFGYAWNKDAQQLEILPEEARLVREIYKQYLQGHPRTAIAEWISERSKARYFDHAVIRDILARPVYMGKLINADLLVDGNHDPIVEVDTWYAAQKEVSRRKEGQSPIGEYLLSGLLECGVCGGNVVHVKRRTRKYGKEYLYELYACRNQHIRMKDRNINCSLGYSKRKLIEKYVIGEIKDAAFKPQKVKEIMERHKTEDAPDGVVTEALREKLNFVLSGLENLYDAIQSGEIKASAVSARIKKLEEERETIELQLEELADRSPQYKSSKNVHMLFKEIGDAWDYLTPDEQKMMIRKVVKKITLKKDSDPEITWNVIE